MEEKTMIRDLTVGNPMKQLLKFAFPFMLANLLQQIYNIADMIIVGQFVGSAGLAAASAGGELAALFLFMAYGFCSAGQIIISQHIGAGSHNRIGKTIGTLSTFIFILVIVFTAFGLVACDWLLRLIRIPDEAAKFGHDYAFTYFCGNISVFGYNVVAAALRGMGDSKRPFIFIAISATLNILLDLLFVGPLHMECFGAALATVLSQTTSFVVSVIYLYRHRDAFGFDFKLKSFAIDRRELSAIVQLGLPLSIQSGAVSISMLYVARYINSFGLVASAATAVGNKFTLVATIVTVALMNAGNSIIAQSFGAGKLKRVSQTIGCILLVAVGFCGLVSAVVLIFPEQVFALFDDNPDVIAMSHSYAPTCAIALMGFATRATAGSFINGIGNSRLSFIAGFIDGIVARIGLSLLFGLQMGMGVYGFWLGSALAGHVIGIVGLFYYLPGKWKNRKLLV